MVVLWRKLEFAKIRARTPEVGTTESEDPSTRISHMALMALAILETTITTVITILETIIMATTVLEITTTATTVTILETATTTIITMAETTIMAATTVLEITTTTTAAVTTIPETTKAFHLNASARVPQFLRKNATKKNAVTFTTQIISPLGDSGETGENARSHVDLENKQEHESASSIIRQLIHQNVEMKINTSRQNPATLTSAVVTDMTCSAGLNGVNGANAQRAATVD